MINKQKINGQTHYFKICDSCKKKTEIKCGAYSRIKNGLRSNLCHDCSMLRPETREKMSKKRAGKNTGKDNVLFGKPGTMLGRVGKNHPAWKGGVTKLNDSIRMMTKYKKWRTEVFQRDNWTCQTCHKRGYVIVHHICSFSNILEREKITSLDKARKSKVLWKVDNGVTLCPECHKIAHNAKAGNVFNLYQGFMEYKN